jgi:hypothetical protein
MANSMKRVRPCKLPEGKLGVYDSNLNLRGIVGPAATSATAARFHGQHGSTLGKVDGRRAWIAPPVKNNGATQRAKARLAKSLKSDKGSVSKTPATAA